MTLTTSENVGLYEARGVSASKSGLHKIVDSMDRGLFPGAFCKVQEDVLTGNPNKCNIIHSDGSGTKSILAYLHYRETADVRVFEGIAQDSIVMNIDDLLCVGAVGNILISSTVNRNKKNFPDVALSGLIHGSEKFLSQMREWGIGVYSGGGETADVGDLTGSVVVDSCATVVMDRKSIIDANQISEGLVIIGLASYGQASYEESENSGIGSNGLTSARHDLLNSYYAVKYPETVDPQLGCDLVYKGPYRLEDNLPGSTMSIGQALLSPTRTYAPVIKELLLKHRECIKGIIHCSGGGQTKCMKFGKGIRFIKDQMLEIPPIFKAIQDASNASWSEMYQVFNMGHRMEIYSEEKDAQVLIGEIKKFGIDAKVIGRTEKSSGINELKLFHQGEELFYKLSDSE